MALWGNTDTDGDKPKNLSAAGKADTFGVSIVEAQTADNIQTGINTPGWVKIVPTYTTADGSIRNKSEVLVAMGSISGDSDSLPPLPIITISVQPQSISVEEPDSAVFSVTATITNGAVLSYQWQKQESEETTWSNIVGATTSSYTIDATIAEDDDGSKYRVIVSGTLGAASVTSSVATLSVAVTSTP